MAEPKKDAKQEIPVKFKKIVDEIDKLGALDLSELVKVLEEHYQVTAAAAPVAMAASSVSNAGSEPASVEEQKSEFDVILKDPGAQKVAVIKAVKDVTGLGLGEAKAIVDSAPKTLKEKVKKEEAEEIKAKLAEAGAVVEIV